MVDAGREAGRDPNMPPEREPPEREGAARRERCNCIQKVECIREG